MAVDELDAENLGLREAGGDGDLEIGRLRLVVGHLFDVLNLAEMGQLIDVMHRQNYSEPHLDCGEGIERPQREEEQGGQLPGDHGGYRRRDNRMGCETRGCGEEMSAMMMIERGFCPRWRPARKLQVRAGRMRASPNRAPRSQSPLPPESFARLHATTDALSSKDEKEIHHRQPKRLAAAACRRLLDWSRLHLTARAAVNPGATGRACLHGRTLWGTVTFFSLRCTNDYKTQSPAVSSEARSVIPAPRLVSASCLPQLLDSAHSTPRFSPILPSLTVPLALARAV